MNLNFYIFPGLPPVQTVVINWQLKGSKRTVTDELKAVSVNEAIRKFKADKSAFYKQVIINKIS